MSLSRKDFLPANRVEINISDAICFILFHNASAAKVDSKKLIPNELPRCKQQGIDRKLSHRPKGQGIEPSSASGGLKMLFVS